MLNISKYTKQQHPFHMVTPSPWPVLTSFSILSFILSLVVYLHISRDFGFMNLNISLVFLVFCFYRWFYDIVVESTFQGNHTNKVYDGLRFGMALFIASEVMFFFSFFWGFFHFSLIPSIFIGAIWPPIGIEILNPWGLPFLNTMILLSSGVTMTWAHRNILASRHFATLVSLGLTISLGLLFTLLQLKEYIEAPFSMNSGIYGSIFFLATGFHGFHVIMGTVILIVCLIRHFNYHFTVEHHFGFEAGAWYWHFVDVVWLFSFTTIYWWGI